MRKNDNDDSVSCAGDNSMEDFLDPDDESMSTTKQNQLEVSRYFYLDRQEFHFTLNYYQRYLAPACRRLKSVDEFYTDEIWAHSVISIEHGEINQSESDRLCFNSGNTLSFRLSSAEKEEGTFSLKPFEFYSGSESNDPFRLINLGNQLTSLDWCPLIDSKSQYLACATTKFTEKEREFTLKSSFESPNLVYVVKFNDLNSETNNVQKFAILNKEIGYISCLKWRPVPAKIIPKESLFIGYLLAASSNGNAYVYRIEDMTLSNRHVLRKNPNSFSQLNVYEPKRQIVLKSAFLSGQCTAADWSELNGAVHIALGYANGLVAIFQMNSSFLREKLECNANKAVVSSELCVYPVQSFDAHLTFVKTVKWSKINGNILATGSLFSRELK